MSGNLYIVSTPIGNLGDITLRAVATLKEVSYIYCEDSRVTKKLLNHFHITTLTKIFHQHSGRSVYNEILEILKNEKNVAIVSDAGTPGISDPGSQLVEFIQKQDNLIKVVPVPGVSAVVTALSVSGFPVDKFLFLGFPPNKNKRKKYFEDVANSKYTVVFYESCHRIEKAIIELSEILDVNTEIFIGRELTKKFESFYKGKIKDIMGMNIPTKGEFVIIIKT
ncbi:MAG: 16S rRNA (cytidine(1402)-2'-O)-methyltransferase [bacterium]|nr:16S rRNA (cytidine(1402)-2'-O)-methyltransferase [bacterium]